MHFIREACHRRPVEPLGLVYSRGGTAITMGCLFIAFCGYLISKMCNDQPLLQISSETINGDFASPDIGLCASNTSISIVKCSAMFVDWTQVDIPNCWERFFRAGDNKDTIKCYVFETNGTYRMGTSLGIEAVNKTALIRLDFYWNIDSVQNMSYSTNSIPAMSVQLYDPSFSTWKSDTVGDSPMEKKTYDNIELGLTRATTYAGFTSSIFYHPQKYRAIRPGDISTMFGLQSNYIDIVTLVNNQHNWPIQLDPPPPPPAFDVKLYQGLFSVQLSQSTIDVKTEVIQHTFLSSIALAGGCYGVLTTIYMLLFGMTRLTPWGMVHHIPVFFNKHAHYNIKANRQDDEIEITTPDDEGFDRSEKGSIAKRKSTEYSNVESVPWFFRSNALSTTDDIKTGVTRKSQDKERSKVDPTELHLLDNKTDSYGKKYGQNSDVQYRERQSPTSPRLPSYYNSAGNSNGIDCELLLARINEALQREQDRSNVLQERTTSLSDRVVELEFILTEYFIDTNYMDKLRFRKSKALSSEDTGA